MICRQQGSCKQNQWYCTSYRRTGFFREKKTGKLQQYKALFIAWYSADHYEVQTTYFWARKPILAIRRIVKSGDDPMDFDDKVVN